ncbi:tetratricopeptide repeat protein, partial [Vibrio breoganii]
GSKNYKAALTHYNKAIYLDSKLPEPYMYRGVLYVQMGDKQRALEDHEALVKMGSPLAEELEYVVKNGREKTPEQFLGFPKNSNFNALKYWHRYIKISMPFLI